MTTPNRSGSRRLVSRPLSCMARPAAPTPKRMAPLISPLPLRCANEDAIRVLVETRERSNSIFADNSDYLGYPKAGRTAIASRFLEDQRWDGGAQQVVQFARAGQLTKRVGQLDDA